MKTYHCHGRNGRRDEAGIKVVSIKSVFAFSYVGPPIDSVSFPCSAVLLPAVRQTVGSVADCFRHQTSSGRSQASSIFQPQTSFVLSRADLPSLGDAAIRDHNPP